MCFKYTMYTFQKKTNDLHISAFTSTTKSHKDINAKCTTVCTYLEVKLSFLALPTWITSSWTIRGKAWWQSLLNLSSEIQSCPIQALWFLSKDEMNLLLRSITPETLPLTLWVSLKRPLSHGRMKKRKSTSLWELKICPKRKSRFPRIRHRLILQLSTVALLNKPFHYKIVHLSSYLYISLSTVPSPHYLSQRKTYWFSGKLS